jgi:hypothetical protein
MAVAAGLGIAIAAAFAAGAAGNPPCASNGTRTFERKADLPRGAADALGFAMAERGAAFQVTDVLGPGPALPGSRFVAARQTGCRLALRYEYGGIAHGFATALLEWRSRGWTVVRAR